MLSERFDEWEAQFLREGRQQGMRKDGKPAKPPCSPGNCRSVSASCRGLSAPACAKPVRTSSSTGASGYWKRRVSTRCSVQEQTTFP